MYTATKNETAIIKFLRKENFSALKKEKLIEEICKNEKSFDAPRQAENAIEGCVAKGFITKTEDGFFKITEEGKKQI